MTDSHSNGSTADSRRTCLGADRLGFTPEVYNERAFQAVAEQVARSPEDFRACHSLAIMHHARAFDLEAGPRPHASDADWRRAAELWHRLWMSDRFWSDLQNRLGPTARGSEAVSVRNALPERLLRIHADIAGHPTTARPRAGFHLRMVRGSPFPNEVGQRILLTAYEAHAAQISREMWSESVVDPERIEQAVDVIEEFLRLDPDSSAALEDALRFELRLWDAWHAELAALGPDDPRRSEVLERAARRGESWRDRFARLPDSLATASVRGLIRWYRTVGDIQEAIGRPQAATAYFDAAVDRARNLPDEIPRCRKASLINRAHLARDAALEGQPGALGECRLIHREPDLPAEARFFLANGYKLLDEFDLAEAACREALQEVGSDPVEKVLAATIRKLKDSLPEARQAFQTEVLDRFGTRKAWLLRNQAWGAHNAGRVPEAIRLLGEAIAAGGAPQVRSELAQVLHQAGIRAFNGDDFATAVPLLRKALAMDAGDADIKSDLATALTLLANEAVRSTRAAGGPVDPKVLDWLSEAVHLDPQNQLTLQLMDVVVHSARRH